MNNKEKWVCPICGSNAYQRYGGVSLPAIRIDESAKPPKYKNISYKMGTHFMCKGCSVFFSNPRIFNDEHIKKRSN